MGYKVFYMLIHYYGKLISESYTYIETDRQLDNNLRSKYFWCLNR